MGIEDRDWYWKERDRKERIVRGQAPFQPEPSGGATSTRGRSSRSTSDSAAVTAAGVLGVILAGLLMVSVMNWWAERTAQKIIRDSQLTAQRVQAQMAEAQRATAEREALRTAELERRESQRVQSIAAQQRIDEERKRAVADEAVRKERASARFYRKPDHCNDAATMECANGFIRAKRAFEQKYARGEL